MLTLERMSSEVNIWASRLAAHSLTEYRLTEPHKIWRHKVVVTLPLELVRAREPCARSPAARVRPPTPARGPGLPLAPFGRARPPPPGPGPPAFCVGAPRPSAARCPLAPFGRARLSLPRASPASQQRSPAAEAMEKWRDKKSIL